MNLDRIVTLLEDAGVEVSEGVHGDEGGVFAQVLSHIDDATALLHNLIDNEDEK